MFSSKVFNQFFEQVPNRADGNCLFESMEYLLENSMYAAATDYTPPSAREIRNMVGKFYREFDKNAEYNESTIEYAIKLGCLFDNLDDHGIAHDRNIVNDKVWASMTDVLICSFIFDVNINLYKYDEENKTYTLEKITSQYDFRETVNLMYNGKNHFEAIVKKFDTKKQHQQPRGGGSGVSKEKRRARSGAFDIAASSMIAAMNRERFTPKKMNYYMALMMEN